MNYECYTCPKPFKSEDALYNHCEALDQAADFLDTLDDPVDNEGWWVYPDDFEGRKSFGYFVCNNTCCKRWWVSAHAIKGKHNKQACKTCNTFSSPIAFWQNENDDDRTFYRKPDDSKLPHDSARCEACIHGMRCTGSSATSFRITTITPNTTIAPGETTRLVKSTTSGNKVHTCDIACLLDCFGVLSVLVCLGLFIKWLF